MTDEPNQLLEDNQDPTDAATDAAIDARLARHLRDALDPHVGAALAKWESLLAEDPADAPRAGPATSQPTRPRRLVIGLRSSAAAMLLLGVGVAIPTLLRQFRPTAVTPVGPAIAIKPASPMFTDAVTTNWTETYDNGTVLVDPTTPARMLRRVQYQKTDWTDDRGQWQSKITVPHDDVILVDLHKQ